MGTITEKTNNIHFISKIKQIFATARPSSVAPAVFFGLFAFITVSFTSLHIRLIKCLPCRAKIAALFCGNNIFSKSRRGSILLTVSTTYGKKAITSCQSRRDGTLLTVGATYGTTIRIIAPARKITAEELDYSVQFLRTQGYNVEFGKNVFGQDKQFSGTDAERALDFQEALDDDNVDVIWFARGGYGSVRIIDKIDFSKFIKRPKWICGYSDVTVFHAYITEVANQISLHATMPINVQGAEIELYSLNTMLSILKTGKTDYNIPFHPLNRVGTANGKLCGGNLSVLYSINGSKSDLCTDGKILFIEDVDEYLYHIDRMMMCLKRSGKLERLAGLIVGGMNKMHDNAVPYGKTAEEVVLEHVAEYDFPVCFGFPAGHTTENRTLIMGGNTSMEVSAEGVILKMNIQ